jgi:sigma-E factor negative regulatory protein RseC
MVVEAYALKPVQVGDQVEIGFQSGVVVQSAFILYLIPLMGLVLGYYVGRILFHGLAVPGREELFPALTSLVFLFASFIPIVFYDRKKRGDRRFRVYIKEPA